jgi:hypothetical protein
MGTPRVERAEAILAHVRERLAGSAIERGDQVAVTMRATELHTVRHGAVVLLPGPAIKYVAPLVQEVTWTLAVVAAPNPDVIAAFTRADEILRALELDPSLALSDATPDAYPMPQPAPDLPGYNVTLTDLFQEE